MTDITISNTTTAEKFQKTIKNWMITITFKESQKKIMESSVGLDFRSTFDRLEYHQIMFWKNANWRWKFKGDISYIPLDSKEGALFLYQLLKYWGKMGLKADALLGACNQSNFDMIAVCRECPPYGHCHDLLASILGKEWESLPFVENRFGETQYLRVEKLLKFALS